MIDNWFPTTVYYSDNNQIDLLDTYKTNCLEILNNIEGESHPFGEASLKTTFWHHTYGHIYKLDEFKTLANEIIDQATLFLNVTGFPGIHPKNIEFLNMWINLIEKHDYHAQHVHSTMGRAYLSGVYYVDAPHGATLNFGSPYRDSYSPVKPYVDNDYNFLLMKYDCIPGRIVMFRSNVYHGYDSHRQEKNKISIPFNLAINKE
jgi:uncharacterized protein (TIGR02466 family)